MGVVVAVVAVELVPLGVALQRNGQRRKTRLQISWFHHLQSLLETTKPALLGHQQQPQRCHKGAARANFCLVPQGPQHLTLLLLQQQQLEDWECQLILWQQQQQHPFCRNAPLPPIMRPFGAMTMLATLNQQQNDSGRCVVKSEATPNSVVSETEVSWARRGW